MSAPNAVRPPAVLLPSKHLGPCRHDWHGRAQGSPYAPFLRHGRACPTPALTKCSKGHLGDALAPVGVNGSQQ